MRAGGVCNNSTNKSWLRLQRNPCALCLSLVDVFAWKPRATYTLPACMYVHTELRGPDAARYTLRSVVRSHLAEAALSITWSKGCLLQQVGAVCGRVRLPNRYFTPSHARWQASSRTLHTTPHRVAPLLLYCCARAYLHSRDARQADRQAPNVTRPRISGRLNSARAPRRTGVVHIGKAMAICVHAASRRRQ